MACSICNTHANLIREAGAALCLQEFGMDEKNTKEHEACSETAILLRASQIRPRFEVWILWCLHRPYGRTGLLCIERAGSFLAINGDCKLLMRMADAYALQETKACPYREATELKSLAHLLRYHERASGTAVLQA